MWWSKFNKHFLHSRRWQGPYPWVSLFRRESLLSDSCSKKTNLEEPVNKQGSAMKRRMRNGEWSWDYEAESLKTSAWWYQITVKTNQALNVERWLITIWFPSPLPLIASSSLPPHRAHLQVSPMPSSPLAHLYPTTLSQSRSLTQTESRSPPPSLS